MTFRSSLVTFAKNRALDHLWDKHQCTLRPDMTPILRRSIKQELTDYPLITEAELSVIGYRALDYLVLKFGIELVGKSAGKEK